MLTDFNLQNYSDILNSFKTKWGDFSNNYTTVKEITDSSKDKKDEYQIKPTEVYDTIEDYFKWFRNNNPLFPINSDSGKFQEQSINLNISAKELEKLLKNSTVQIKEGVDLSDLSPEIKGLIQVLHNQGAEVTITSARRNGATTKQGRPSRHSIGQALDIVPTDRQNYAALKNTLSSQSVQEYLAQHKLGVLDETSESMQQTTGATGPHYHIGSDIWGKEYAMKFN